MIVKDASVVVYGLEAFDVALAEADEHLVDVFASLASALHGKLPPAAQQAGLDAFEKVLELGCGLEALRDMLAEYRGMLTHVAFLITPDTD